MVVKIKSLEEVHLAHKKQLPLHPVQPLLIADLDGLHLNHLGHLATEQNSCQRHACQHAKGEVVRGGEHGDCKGHQHHRGVALGDATQVAQTVDVSSADSDADHHGHKSRHRNLLEPGPSQQDHRQQAHPREQGGQSRAAAVVHIHHGLTHQGTTGHATEQGGNDVGDALAPGLNVFVGGGVGLVVEDVLGQEGFHQTHQRDGQGGGKHQAKGVQTEGNTTFTKGKAEGGQTCRKGAEAADRGDVEAESHADRGQHDDGHQL